MLVRILFLSLVTLWLSQSLAQNCDAEAISHFAEREQAGEWFATPDWNGKIDLQQAYCLQGQLLDRLAHGDALAGFKAGLTSTAAQKKFGLETPASAGLWQSRQLSDAQALSLNDLRGGLVEIELGFRLNQDISKPITTTEGLIASTHAVVEIAELRFKQLPSIETLIASNLGSGYVLVSAPIDFHKQSVVQLNHEDGQAVAATAQNIDHHAILKWLINQRLALGDTLKKGQLIITGSLAKPEKPRKGTYTLHYQHQPLAGFTLHD